VAEEVEADKDHQELEDQAVVVQVDLVQVQR